METVGDQQDLQQQLEGDACKCFNDLMKFMTIRSEERDNFLEELPAAVVNKVRALKKLQLECVELDIGFHREIYEIERKFENLHRSIYTKRFEIINGNYEPNEEECLLPDNVEDNIKGKEENEKPNINGIPNFWLTVIKKCPELCAMVKSTDVPILEKLTDIRAITKPLPELSFYLEFHFALNEYFTDSVLTKTFMLNCSPDEECPFSFHGPEIVKAIGCQINWRNVNDNLNQKFIDGKLFKSDSFFNFFTPPDVENYIDQEDKDKLEEYLETDFEIGFFIKERLIPRAVLYYTGDLYFTLESEDDDTESDSPQSPCFSEDPVSDCISGDGDN